MSLTPEQIAELRRLNAERTHAPWVQFADRSHGHAVELLPAMREGRIARLERDEDLDADDVDANAAFIAAIANAADALLSAAEENARLREAAEIGLEYITSEFQTIAPEQDDGSHIAEVARADWLTIRAALEPCPPMSDLAALSSLLARVEAATGADRRLDRDLNDAFGIDNRFHGDEDYTASLDAAIALCERVLPDVVWSVRGNADLVRGHKAEALLSRFDSERVCFRDIGDVSHFTPALALLAAILRAKIAEMTP